MSDPVNFDIIAADAGAEIFLIDGNFNLVKKGIGRETFSVPPGIYKIKNRTGRVTAERMIVVRKDMEPIQLDPALLSTAMPLLLSSKTHEFHMAAARKAAEKPDLELGSGSAIVIVARQWTADSSSETAESPRNPGRGLTLKDMKGAVLADVEALTKVSGTFDPCVTLDVALDPGSYRLALAYENGRRVEQTLIASQGWQTQIYLLVDGKDTARVDLINSSITMRKPGQPFDPGDQTLRTEEIVRGALQDSHKILSDEMRASMIRADASPMLALIGAHLLISEMSQEGETRVDPLKRKAPVDNRDALRKIVENLRAAIGRHPDVEAIATAAGTPNPEFVFEAPPMLRASWPLLLRASVQRPDAVPSASVTAHVAERIWGGGPWLQWLDTGPDGTTDRAALWQAKARELLQSIAAKSPTKETASGTVSPTQAQAEDSPSVTAALAAAVPTVKSFFARRSRTPFPDSPGMLKSAGEPRAPPDLSGVGATLTGGQREELVKRLGIPMSSIDAWLQKGK